MAARHCLTLTEAEQAELERIRDRDARPYLREKAAALLKIASGQSPRQVALTGLLKPREPDTVYRWLREWRQDKAVRVRPPCRRPFSPRRPGQEGNP
jgi:hypothetical protein